MFLDLIRKEIRLLLRHNHCKYSLNSILFTNESFTVENELLTPTGKLSRLQLKKHFSTLINEKKNNNNNNDDNENDVEDWFKSLILSFLPENSKFNGNLTFIEVCLVIFLKKT